MKKLAYITLIAAFVFGVQPQEAFSANDVSMEMEMAANSNAKIDLNEASGVLTVFMSSEKREKAQIVIYQNGIAVAKETVMINARETTVEIDLSGFASGIFTAKIDSETIQFKQHFKKK